MKEFLIIDKIKKLNRYLILCVALIAIGIIMLGWPAADSGHSGKTVWQWYFFRDRSFANNVGWNYIFSNVFMIVMSAICCVFLGIAINKSKFELYTLIPGAMRIFDKNISLIECLKEVKNAHITRLPKKFDQEGWTYKHRKNYCADYIMNLLQFVEPSLYEVELRERERQAQLAARKVKMLIPLWIFALAGVIFAILCLVNCGTMIFDHNQFAPHGNGQGGWNFYLAFVCLLPLFFSLGIYHFISRPVFEYYVLKDYTTMKSFALLETETHIKDTARMEIKHSIFGLIRENTIDEEIEIILERFIEKNKKTYNQVYQIKESELSKKALEYKRQEQIRQIKESIAKNIAGPEKKEQSVLNQ